MKHFRSVYLRWACLVGGAVGLAACAAQKGPLNPRADLLGLNNPGAASPLPRVTAVSVSSLAPMETSTAIRFYFSTPVNPVTLNTATVAVYSLSTTGVLENAYPNFTLAYDSGAMALVVSPDRSFNGGTWTNNRAYRVELRTGIQGVTGAPLDGNKNNIAESPEFDNFSYTVYTGSPFTYVPNHYVSLVALTATYYSDDSANTLTSASFSGAGTGVAGADAGLPVTITASFGLALDPATVWAGPTALHPNLAFTDPAGGTVAPAAVTLTSGDQTLQLFFTVLQPSTRYQLVFKGGLTGIRSAQQPYRPLLRGVYFDGNDNGIAEASDNSHPRYLQTNKAGGGSNLAPYVNPVEVTFDFVNWRWVIPFHTPSGNGTMDVSTLTASNLILYSGNGVNFSAELNNIYNTVPDKDIVYDSSSNTVYVYVPPSFPTHFSDNMGNFAYIKVMITHAVKSADGIGFDGSGDHVGSGTAADDLLLGDNGSGGNAVKLHAN